MLFGIDMHDHYSENFVGYNPTHPLLNYSTKPDNRAHAKLLELLNKSLLASSQVAQVVEYGSFFHIRSKPAGRLERLKTREAMHFPDFDGHIKTVLSSALGCNIALDD